MLVIDKVLVVRFVVSHRVETPFRRTKKPPSLSFFRHTSSFQINIENRLSFHSLQNNFQHRKVKTIIYKRRVQSKRTRGGEYSNQSSGATRK